MVGLLRIAPAARAVAEAHTLLLPVALTKADGLTNASTTPNNTSAAATTALMTNMSYEKKHPQSRKRRTAVCVCVGAPSPFLSLYVRLTWVSAAGCMYAPAAHANKKKKGGVPQISNSKHTMILYAGPQLTC